ncbi:hypothetical protein ACFWJ5_05080 [Streptomyces qaidamensis]|uniref:hypothetical protein n=1 Tax=Streptomyces qaidamensis TaxID=1783515 RepID=UPI00365E8839
MLDVHGEQVVAVHGEALRGAQTVRQDHRPPVVEAEHHAEPVVADVAAPAGVAGHVHGAVQSLDG